MKRIIETVWLGSPRQRRYSLKAEMALIALPTLTILLMLLLLEMLAGQRILFASLAASAFLIYREPYHPMNSLRSLLISQTGGAIIGFSSDWLLGESYAAAAAAMVATIVFIISFNAIHPPAVSTALSFAFQPLDMNIFFLFLLALGMVCGLVGMEQAALWLIQRLETDQSHDNKTA